MEQHRESLGRIEVAPEVLATIAQFAVRRVDGVAQMAPIPPHIANMFRKATRQDGIVLDVVDNRLRFNIYVIMEPQVNVLEASREMQSAVTEAIDTLVGIPVDTVNIHVEDVEYAQGDV
ncbi:MAG: Asp23/Gls24 family envelope stress response protein [Candidatus Promineifilaceae bacterium]|jgi:uncharacterized alkaline shock family protein YloU